MGLFHPKSRIQLDASAIGVRAEVAIISRLTSTGYNVLKPVNPSLRYDLVIEDADGRFHRIQCKAGRYKSGSVQFHCKNHSTSRYDKAGFRGKSYRGECDYFAVYCHDLNAVYLVSTSELPEQLAALRVDPISDKRVKSQIRWAADYEL